MKMNVYFKAYLLALVIALGFSSCEDDPITPNDPNDGTNGSDTTWTNDSTSNDPNGGNNDSTWTDPNGGGSNPGDSTGG